MAATAAAIVIATMLSAAYFFPPGSQTVENHVGAPGFNQTAMLERGDTAMGFNQSLIHHHFITTPTGGEIIIMSTNMSDSRTISEIRSHVREIRDEFSQGNFTKPFYIHAQNVPGTATMASKKDLIRYSIRDMDGGASLILSTNDTGLLEAIKDFMDFQSRQHMGH